jgi:ribokinase
MINKAFDVVGVGYCAFDYLGIVGRYPALDEKMRMDQFAMQCGGVTATAMVTVARLGGRASYIGKVGGDDFGSRILSALQSEGVDVGSCVVDSEAASPFGFVVVDKTTGKRTIFWTSSGMRLEPGEICRADVLAGTVLHIDDHHADAALLASSWAKEAGIPVVMDAGSVRPRSAEVVEKVDCLIMSSTFARDFTGESDPEKSAVSMLESRRISAVTLGDHGCVYATRDGVAHQPAFPVEVVDTTGAGDVFHGAFSFGLSQGWEFARIIEFASATAALKCSQLGGQAGIPGFREVRDFLDSKSIGPQPA